MDVKAFNITTGPRGSTREAYLGIARREAIECATREEPPGGWETQGAGRKRQGTGLSQSSQSSQSSQGQGLV